MSIFSLPYPVKKSLLSNKKSFVHSIKNTCDIEKIAAVKLGDDVLMRRAGQAIASWVLALRPHAKIFWVACGAGNNGNDGLVAAAHLARAGKKVCASLPPEIINMPLSWHWAVKEAGASGVTLLSTVPSEFDVGIDALLGIGADRMLQGYLLDCSLALGRSNQAVLAVDLPSGLSADTGFAYHGAIKALATLSLLSLKLGLFTGDGAAYAGEIWFHDLDYAPDSQLAMAELVGAGTSILRSNNTNKGSFGSVVVVGGADKMMGAAVLASTSALHIGSGRVYVSFLTEQGKEGLAFAMPALMRCDLHSLPTQPFVFAIGCGAGSSIGPHLKDLLISPQKIVIDADALNLISANDELKDLLKKRAMNYTVMTPHPLEAARLLGWSVEEVQANRMKAALTIQKQYHCVLVLKGSGSIVVGFTGIPAVIVSGNARLATAGTGDVLTGMIAGLLAQGWGAFEATVSAAWQHGEMADHWPSAQSFDAWTLAQAVQFSYSAKDGLN